MDKTTTYKLAGISTAITGKNKYALKLKEYFQGAETNIAEPISIFINICDTMNEMKFDDELKFFAEGKGLQISDTGFMTNIGRLRYRVDNLFVKEEPVHIWIYYDERCGLRKWAKTIFTYMDPYMLGRESETDRFITDVLDYTALWWILALAFLKYDRAFVHSGMAEKQEKGVVVAGTGGCGKTSAVSELLNEGWKYIAEDFGVICADGSIWQIPKRGAISAEDVSYGSSRLIKLIDQLPRVQKVRWNYFSKKGVNPIIAPSLDELYGKENIAQYAKLCKIVYVARSTNERIVKKCVSIDEMTSRIKGASFRVIREMYNILYNIQAVADEEIRKNFLEPMDIEKRYCDIISRALENAEYSVLEVPIKVNPNLIKEYVVQDLFD